MKTLAPESPVETLYREGRKTFIEWVPDGGARLDALFHAARCAAGTGDGA
jgi:4-carboxymuconolactone decarboxylase